MMRGERGRGGVGERQQEATEAKRECKGGQTWRILRSRVIMSITNVLCRGAGRRSCPLTVGNACPYVLPSRPARVLSQPTQTQTMALVQTCVHIPDLTYVCDPTHRAPDG